MSKIEKVLVAIGLWLLVVMMVTSLAFGHAAVLPSAIIGAVGWAVWMTYAWVMAYWNSDIHNRFGVLKVKPTVREYDPTGMRTYK